MECSLFSVIVANMKKMVKGFEFNCKRIFTVLKRLLAAEKTIL
jgi:hypothetical protein